MVLGGRRGWGSNTGGVGRGRKRHDLILGVRDLVDTDTDGLGDGPIKRRPTCPASVTHGSGLHEGGGRRVDRAHVEQVGPTAWVARFTEALDEDLNVSAAWGAVFEWVRETNRLLGTGQLSAAPAAAALAAWARVDTVLGLGAAAVGELPAELQALLDERLAARKAKDFKRSDAIRDELKTKGWVIEDTPKGARLKKL